MLNWNNVNWFIFTQKKSFMKYISMSYIEVLLQFDNDEAGTCVVDVT